MSCILLLLFLSLAAPAHAAERGAPRFVRLWNEAVTANLENENRLAELCPPSLDPAGLAACREAKLRPRSWRLSLREKPAPQSKRIGTLNITATPGKGLSYEYLPVAGKPAPFVPDLFDGDWGYGPYADHTALEESGGWVLLPARPFPRPVWLDFKAGLGSAPELYEPVEAGRVYAQGGRHRIVKELRPDGLLLRDEIPADMPCGDEGVPSGREPKAELVPWAELYDADGHFTLIQAYTRGC